MVTYEAQLLCRISDIFKLLHALLQEAQVTNYCFLKLVNQAAETIFGSTKSEKFTLQLQHTLLGKKIHQRIHNNTYEPITKRLSPPNASVGDPDFSTIKKWIPDQNRFGNDRFGLLQEARI